VFKFILKTCAFEVKKHQKTMSNESQTKCENINITQPICLKEEVCAQIQQEIKM
jgi:hypothetical protein